ncbi:MAG: hypothetical protein AAGU76_09095 [Sedimentibacter sp.]|uniref:hypothetical protein n=1 Tax=Sedimentibacter sp. TaxID=1960295 RepID=UPI0031593932
MNNKNYRVMKFFEPVDKKEKARGYVRLDIRGIKGTVIVSVENLGDVKTTSEVYLYKDKINKIKLGDINNKKGMLKKILTFGSNNAIEDYNVCAIVKGGKISLYSNLFNPMSLDAIRKLDTDDENKAVLAVPEEKLNVQTVQKVLKEETRRMPEEDEKPLRLDKSLPVEELINTEEEAIKEELIDETVQEEIENHDAEMAFDEAKSDVSKQDARTETSESPSSQGEKEKIRYKNKFNESLYNALKDYQKTEPLSVKIKNFNWWHIPYDEMGIKNGFLPYYNQIISSYYPYPMSNRVTTCSNLMKKYGHYVFGIYEENGDIAKFIYGIPGEFTKEEQPYKGITGFKNWSYSNKEDNLNYGYWLAFVNPKTGEATEPPQIVLTK